MKKEILENVTDQIIKFRNKFGDEKTVEMFQDAIIKSNNSSLCYWFAENIRNIDAKALGKVIIKSGNAEDNYEFASNINDADIDAHEKAILESKDPEYNYRFIKHFENANKEAHIDVILKSGNAEYMWFLAEFYDKDNFKRYIDPIIETKDPEYIYRIADLIDKNKVDGYNLEELEQIVIDSKDDFSNYLWASNFKNCRFKEHEKVILESKNYIRCYSFSSLPGADIKKLGQVIIDSKNIDYNLKFVLEHTTKSNLREHAMVIIKSRNPKYNYDFADMVYPKIDPEEYNNYSDLIELHAKAVVKSKNLFYNYMFASLPGADKDMHLQVIIDSKKKKSREEYLLDFARHFKDIDGNIIYDALKTEVGRICLRNILNRDFEQYNQTKDPEIEEQSKKINKLIIEL